MATSAPSRPEPTGTVVETHKSFQPRILFFHFVIVALLLTLAGGLAYQQLINTSVYNERERVQNQRGQGKGRCVEYRRFVGRELGSHI